MDSSIENPKKENLEKITTKESINIGSCIKIKNSKKTFQIIGLNQSKSTCWIREWPLTNKPYSKFELSMNKIILSVICPLNHMLESK